MLDASALLVIFILVVSEEFSIAEHIEEEKVIVDFKRMVRFRRLFFAKQKTEMQFIKRVVSFYKLHFNFYEVKMICLIKLSF